MCHAGCWNSQVCFFVLFLISNNAKSTWIFDDSLLCWKYISFRTFVKRAIFNGLDQNEKLPEYVPRDPPLLSNDEEEAQIQLFDHVMARRQFESALVRIASHRANLDWSRAMDAVRLVEPFVNNHLAALIIKCLSCNSVRRLEFITLACEAMEMVGWVASMAQTLSQQTPVWMEFGPDAGAWNFDAESSSYEMVLVSSFFCLGLMQGFLVTGRNLPAFIDQAIPPTWLAAYLASPSVGRDDNVKKLQEVHLYLCLNRAGNRSYATVFLSSRLGACFLLLVHHI